MGNCTSNAPTTPIITQSQFRYASNIVSDDTPTNQSIEIPIALKPLIRPENANSNVRNNFEWHREIGHGKYGIVYAVTYQNEDCAVKRIARKNRLAETAFISEVTVLSDLRHQGIIGFIDAFIDEEYFYVAMERADFDLDQLLRTTGCFDEEWIRCIIRALLETVAYLHSNDIAHCDLKPSNIMWSQNLMTLKLIEFGDSKVVEADEIHSKFRKCFHVQHVLLLAE